jgi:O-antigen/teichoic acid export membrane protein
MVEGAVRSVAGQLTWDSFLTGWRGLMVPGTASMTLGQLARLGTQAVYFIIAARALGPAEYGYFAAAAAVAGVAAPFANWGAGEVLLQNVSRSRHDFAFEWGAALSTIARFGLAGILLTAAAATALFPAIPLVLIIAVAAAEFWFAGLVAVAANAFQAVEDFRHATRAWFVLSAARLGGAALLVLLVPDPAAIHWGIVYVLSSAIAALIVTLAVNRRIGPPRPGRVPGNRIKGFEFAVSLSSGSLSAEVGKMSLSRFDRMEVTGAYAAADRIIGVVSVPILAVLGASYPRLHRAGLLGMRAAVRLCLPLLSVTLAYAVVAAVAAYFCAPFIERFLGIEYHQAVAACQFLCGLLLLRTLTSFAANCLTATNHQRWRSTAQVVGACLSAVLAFTLVQQYSWRGAAVAALVSEAILGSLLWILILTVAARERPAIEEQ